MTTNPASPSQPDEASAERVDRPVQTGARPGLQPGEGVNTSASPTGQSNTDARVGEGVGEGKHDRHGR